MPTQAEPRTLSESISPIWHLSILKCSNRKQQNQISFQLAFSRKEKYDNQTHQVLSITESPTLTWSHFDGERKRWRHKHWVLTTERDNNCTSHVSHRYIFFFCWVKLEMSLIQYWNIRWEGKLSVQITLRKIVTRQWDFQYGEKLMNVFYYGHSS